MKRQQAKSSAKTISVPAEEFPARVYAETILAINFGDSARCFLGALLEIHAAHVLMLARQKMVSVKDARAYLIALDGLDRTKIERTAYDGRFEDLFFYIEHQLELACGKHTTGQMRAARSRNDVDLTLYRMVLRLSVIQTAELVHQARRVLLNLAADHVGTLMPAYTHTQPAQPTTLAHYLLGALEIFGRDEERLRAAFATINRSPLGACAITTTGFPIDRDYTARLLGFEGLQLNSYGAIAAVDYLTEAASALAVVMVNLGRLVQDLLLWCMAEFRFLRLAEGYVQCSSIMPQKRNPVSLEHTRILASKALSQAQAVLISLHNTPFGDIVDSEDDLLPLVFSAFVDAGRALRLFAGLMGDVKVDRAHLQARAAGNFLTVTELADTLVRNEAVTFDQAHRLVSAAVKAAGGDDSHERLAREVSALAPGILKRSLTIGHGVLMRALDPGNFVRLRKIPGGPAPQAVAVQIQNVRRSLARDAVWLRRKRKLMADYPKRLRISELKQ